MLLFMYKKWANSLRLLNVSLSSPQNPGKLTPNTDFYIYISMFKNIF